MREDKLGTMPIGELLLSMSLPIMVSFFIQALYNMVDSMFVARLSESALTATSLAFPFQQVAHAIGVGTGIGLAAVIPRYAAKKQLDKANLAAHTGIVLALIYSVFFFLLGLCVTQYVYPLLTGDIQIIQQGQTYLKIVWMVSFGIFIGQIFEKMLMSASHSMMAMIAQASGAIFNIIVDPLLIFGIGPFPEMGIAGAAIATVLGQILSTIVGGVLNYRYNRWIQLSLSQLKLDIHIAKEIIVVAIPSMITIGLSAITSFCVNLILMGYSATATAVYGIWIKLQSFCFMPLFGLNNALIPILSFNHAKERNDRVRHAISLGLKVAFILMVGLMIILEIVPNGFLQLFKPSKTMLEIGNQALRICCLSLPFAAISIIRSASMQALKHSTYTLIINVLRQFVFLVGFFIVLSSLFHNVDMVWFALPLTEILSAIVATVLNKKMNMDLHQ